MVGEDFIKIDDEYVGYDPNSFCIPSHYKECLESVIIPKGMALDRAERLAEHILYDNGSTPLHALCVLKGGYQFYGDLMNVIKTRNAHLQNPVPISLDFIRVKSYVNDQSTGEVKVTESDNLENIAGKNVLIVEDIIDTGRTMDKLLKVLQKYKPASIKVVTLLVKRAPNSTGYRPDYIGFEVPDKFIVGYAIDYNECFRDLHHVCIVNDYGKKKYAIANGEH